MSQQESDLQRAVVKYLDLQKPPCQWFHVPNGGYRRRKEAAIMSGLGLKAGVPDLVFIWSEGAAFVELKTKSGRLSQAQKAWRNDCQKRGIPYFIVRDVTEIRGVLKELGLL